MAWQKTFDPVRYKRSQIILSFILFIALVIIGLFLWRVFYLNDTVIETTPISQLEPSTVEESPLEAPEETTEPFDAVAINNALQKWQQTVPGKASVVVRDSQSGAILATSTPDEQYFAASIYKLYVAYEGYKQVDQAIVDPAEVYLNGFTRAECLDKMIRESDSPCAEKLWGELGKEQTSEQLKAYGINNTSMTSLTTTAADAATMLFRIASGEGLSEGSRQLFLDSMQAQIYRDTLNKSFTEADGYTVYNKIGFRELDEYHDAAIVTLPDDRSLIISVFTSGVGTTNIVRLGTELKAALTSVSL